MAKAKQDYLYQLDSLRGVAAVVIVLLHFCAYLLPRIGDSFRAITPVFDRSYLAVDLFFILSGFVMAYKYSSVFEWKVDISSYRNFMFRRFIRIYPLHIIVLALLVLLHWGGESISLGMAEDPFKVIRNKFTLVSNVFLLHSSGIGDQGCYNCTSWNYPSWSISAEWLSYFLIPFVVLFFKKWRQLASFISLILFGGLYFMIEARIGHLDVASSLGWYRCISEMFLGVLVYYVGFGRFRVKEFWVNLFFGITILLIHFRSPDSFVVALIAILLLLVVNSHGHRVLDFKWLRWLGQRSYSIYIVHALVQDVLSFGWRMTFLYPVQDSGKYSQLTMLFIAFSLTLFAAHFFYENVEVRFATVLKKSNPKTNLHSSRIPI